MGPTPGRRCARPGPARGCVTAGLPGYVQRPADVRLHDQLIDARTAAQHVLGQHRQAKSRIEYAPHQRRPGTSGGQYGHQCGPRFTARASAVLKDIGFWLPKRSKAVARASPATITVTPIAAHSRPPASDIAAATRAARDGTSARRSAAPGSGSGDISSGADGVSPSPRTSTGYSPPTPMTTTAAHPPPAEHLPPGEIEFPGSADVEVLTRLTGPARTSRIHGNNASRGPRGRKCRRSQMNCVPHPARVNRAPNGANAEVARKLYGITKKYKRKGRPIIPEIVLVFRSKIFPQAQVVRGTAVARAAERGRPHVCSN